MGERNDVIGTLGAVHLIGIGGVGMSAIAKVLLSRGVAVSGSDAKDLPAMAALRALGARVDARYDAANVREPDTVVVSSATRETNPELVAARERGIAVLHRAQMLSLLMRSRRGIAVSGTHGKTTTTAMIALALQRAGLDPSFLIGGDLNEPGTNAYDGSGEWLVAEADESDGSLLWLGPEIAVVTNIEAEHLDHYRGGIDEIYETFLSFTQAVPPHGALVACADDAGVRAILPRCRVPVVTYGLADGRWRGERVDVGAQTQRIRVSYDGAVAGELVLAVPGEHNARNALAAVAVAALAGVPFDTAAEALESFAGVRRRFQERGTASGVTVVDDYAHHPTEVRALLRSARERTGGRLLAVFQPHLYSRTAYFAADLGAALADADVVVVTDVYGAREEPQPGVTGKLVVDGLLASAPRARVAYLPKRGDIAPYVAGRARRGDLVLTIGAGDVTMLGDEILLALAGRS